MIQRLKRSISKPQHLLMNINDSYSRVFLYLLMMVLIMTIPAILVGIFNPGLLLPTQDEINQEISQKFNYESVEIVDGKFNDYQKLTTNYFTISDYYFVIGNIPSGITGVITHFAEEDLVIYLATGGVLIESSRESYLNINLENATLSSSDSTMIANRVINFLIQDKTIIYRQVSKYFVSNLYDYLILALILAAFATFFYRLPIKFGANFKISVYVLTIWSVLNLALTFFGIADLSFLTIVVASIYQVRAYRSLRIIKRG